MKVFALLLAIILLITAAHAFRPMRLPVALVRPATRLRSMSVQPNFQQKWVEPPDEELDGQAFNVFQIMGNLSTTIAEVLCASIGVTPADTAKYGVPGHDLDNPSWFMQPTSPEMQAKCTHVMNILCVHPWFLQAWSARPTKCTDVQQVMQLIDQPRRLILMEDSIPLHPGKRKILLHADELLGLKT